MRSTADARTDRCRGRDTARSRRTRRRTGRARGPGSFGSTQSPGPMTETRTWLGSALSALAGARRGPRPALGDPGGPDASSGRDDHHDDQQIGLGAGGSPPIRRGRPRALQRRRQRLRGPHSAPRSARQVTCRDRPELALVIVLHHSERRNCSAVDAAGGARVVASQPPARTNRREARWGRDAAAMRPCPSGRLRCGAAAGVSSTTNRSRRQPGWLAAERTGPRCAGKLGGSVGRAGGGGGAAAAGSG